jgi:hypothetical protein
VKNIHIGGRTSIFVRAAMYLALLFVGFSGVTAVAQSTEIDGSILDSQRAQVSGARVSITRTETGERREAISNQEGNYAFPVVQPGHYEVKVEKNGFGTQVKTGVEALTDKITAVDFVLQPGAVQEQVVVNEAGALLQTESSTVSSVIENETIVNLPLLDRRASQLQRLNGFVTSAGTGSGTTFAIAGGRGNNATYYIDGGTATNLLQGVETLVFDLPVDSLQEFNLTVSDYAAEYGQSGGGIISMTTKSGTNQFHGSAYTYYRTNKISAVPNFAAPNPITGNLTTSPLNYKIFGGSIGGPILKDKTHFFFTWEGKYVTSSTPLELSVPTVAETQGDFSGAIASLIAANPAQNAGLQLTDPNTGKQAVGDDGTLNKLPSAELDRYGKKLASYFPAPNLVGAPLNSNNYAAYDPARLVDNTYVVRIDHNLGQRDTLYGRFLGEPQHTDTADVFPTPGTDNFGALAHQYYYSEAGTYTHTFSPTLINEVRLAFTQRQGLSISHGINSAAEKALALPGINPTYFPGVNVQGLTSIGNVGQQERLQTPILSNEYTDNLSWQRGNHQFKIGASYRTSADGDKYYPYAGGLFGFIGSTNVSTATPIASLANLLLGRVDNAQRIETEYLHSLAWTWGAYIQDAWKVNSKLTLNLGLRYDVESPRYLDNNHQNSFNTTEINPVSGTPGVVTFAGINGQSKYANNFDDKLVGPRAGFAYTPREHLVVRGGGSILYPGEYDAATPVTAFTGFSNSISLASTNSKAGAPSFILADNLTEGVGTAAFPTISQLTPGFGAVAVGSKTHLGPQFYRPKRSNGYLYQANLDLQRELPGNLLLDLGYLGTYGHHLVLAGTAESINQIAPSNVALLRNGAVAPSAAQTLRPFPQFTNVQYLGDDVGQSNYNGINLGIQKRFSHGLQYQANYTWSKFIDNQVSRNELAGYPGNDSFTDYYNPRDRYGYSGNDVRNRIIGNALYDLPVGRGRLVNIQNRWVDSIVGGWTASGVTEYHSGTALSPIVSGSNVNGLYADGVRPNLVPGQNPNKVPGGRSKAEWFNTAAFEFNPSANPSELFTFGNAPRTFGRGPSLFNTDATLLKKFHVYESSALEFRVEALNVFNHANLGNPNTSYTPTSATFGTISGLQSGATPSRVVQLAAHFTF